jgi:hypothetical protein
MKGKPRMNKPVIKDGVVVGIPPTTSNFYNDLKSLDFVYKMTPLLKKGWAFRHNKFVMLEERTWEIWFGEWVFVRKPTGRDCILWHIVMFDHFGIMPTPCLGCWKVVARPKTVVDLVRAWEVMEKLNFPSKCGIETRPYVPYNYGCYFYCDNEEQGHDRARTVLDEFQSAGVEFHPGAGSGVTLKRYCTEFEMKFGPSNRFNQPEEHDQYTRLVGNHCEALDWSGQTGSPLTLIHVMRKWIEFAMDRGDHSYKRYNHGEHVFAPPITYERREP